MGKYHLGWQKVTTRCCVSPSKDIIHVRRRTWPTATGLRTRPLPSRASNDVNLFFMTSGSDKLTAESPTFGGTAAKSPYPAATAAAAASPTSCLLGPRVAPRQRALHSVSSRAPSLWPNLDRMVCSVSKSSSGQGAKRATGTFLIAGSPKVPSKNRVTTARTP